MRLKELTLKDRKLFNRYLNLTRHELSVYSFANLYIWKNLYQLKWLKIKGSLCVFFLDKTGCFMNLPPLAKKLDPRSVAGAFKIMDSFNKNPAVSRIENIEAEDINFYNELGLVCPEKSVDYICSRDQLAGLSGDKFKPKRASYNYFLKNYCAEYLSYSPGDKTACLDLYSFWQQTRALKCQDKAYLGMMEDSFLCLKNFLQDYEKLGCIGRVVKIDNQIKGLSFGYRLNRDTFCILYEITDLTVKGLAQFIFRRFCAELKDFRYINIMDDSGLENLKRVKLSYAPVKLTPAYIAQRKDARKYSGS